MPVKPDAKIKPTGPLPHATFLLFWPASLALFSVAQVIKKLTVEQLSGHEKWVSRVLNF